MRSSSFGSHLRFIDFYALLHVRRDASTDEIRRAYRRGALEYHPDRMPGDHHAAEQFLLLTQARDILLDPALRAEYDRLREDAAGAEGEPPAAAGSHARRPGRRNAADPLNEHRLARRAQRSRSSAELAALWRIGTTVVRASILRNVSCPLFLFDEACVVEHWMLGLEAANQAGCPVKVLDKLAFSFERSVAMAVASHPAASEAALDTIAARHHDLPILTAVAVHRNAGPAALRQVGRAVRGPRSAPMGSAVLAHPACPTDVALRIRQRLGHMVA